MTQYCRYCCYCMTANGNWCGAQEKPLTDAQIKHTNKCKDFEFTPMDAWDCEREYKPRPKREPVPELDNMSLFEGE